jgi:hypothetical protein
VVVVSTFDHTAAVITALATTGRPVGDAVAPPAASAPYVVVYPQGGNRDGPIGDPDSDAGLVYQFTCVGRDRQGAQWMADRVAEAVRNVVIPGRGVMRVEPLNDSPVERDTDVTPPLFYVTPIYRLHTTPT